MAPIIDPHALLSSLEDGTGTSEGRRLCSAEPRPHDFRCQCPVTSSLRFMRLLQSLTGVGNERLAFPLECWRHSSPLDEKDRRNKMALNLRNGREGTSESLEADLIYKLFIFILKDVTSTSQVMDLRGSER